MSTSIVRKFRKRFTRNPAREKDIVELFQKVISRPPTPAEIKVFEQKYLTRRALEKRLGKTIAVKVPAGQASIAGLPQHLAQLSDEEFVECVYLSVSDRYPSPDELQTFADHLRSGAVERTQLIMEHFAEAGRETIAQQNPPKHSWISFKTSANSHPYKLMGTPVTVIPQEWQRLSRSRPEKSVRPTTHARFPLKARQSEVDVSVICSMWRGGEYIERYMDNITSQSIFTDRCELIIVDAASPEGEASIIERYKKRLGDRIVYHRMPHRAGIYSAWNYGVGIARGKYLTNANLDDLRRQDSLERQASALDALSFVDVVYDDHLYSFDAEADFEMMERAGAASELPLVTRSNMFSMNPPHNGPMWRASLHDKLGQFDESYRSAGDYEFWLRALIEGAVFYKLNEPTVGYFVNPEGLSTSADSYGVQETRRALKKHGKTLVPKAVRESPDEFIKRLGMSDWPQSAGKPVARYALVQKKMREVARRHTPHGRP